MTTTAAAENLAGRAVVEKKEDRVEKRRALGRGLESLLPGPRVVTGPDRSASTSAGDKPAAEAVFFPVPAIDAAVAQHVAPVVDSISEPRAFSGNVVQNLSIDLIDKNPYQTRQAFDEEQMIELRDSIKEHGVVQPVVVRLADTEGRYVLVLGERRLRASKMAEKETIPALVRRLSPQQAAEMTVLENVVREDLNPVEQAEAFRVLSKEFHLTQMQIAERIGVSRETVANYMRLLRLPRKVMDYMLADRLSFSDAREILRLESEEHIELVAEEVVTKRLKWDEIAERVMRLNGSLPMVPGAAKKAGARWMDPNVRAAQTEMERTLGMRVRIKDRNGKGKIVIEYASVDDYERVVAMLNRK
jgi:ParB family chromosome partitioning protein